MFRGNYADVASAKPPAAGVPAKPTEREALIQRVKDQITKYKDAFTKYDTEHQDLMLKVSLGRMVDKAQALKSYTESRDEALMRKESAQSKGVVLQACLDLFEEKKTIEDLKITCVTERTKTNNYTRADGGIQVVLNIFSKTKNETDALVQEVINHIQPPVNAVAAKYKKGDGLETSLLGDKEKGYGANL